MCTTYMIIELWIFKIIFFIKFIDNKK
jgi:hypothetical protein